MRPRMSARRRFVQDERTPSGPRLTPRGHAHHLQGPGRLHRVVRGSGAGSRFPPPRPPHHRRTTTSPTRRPSSGALPVTVNGTNVEATKEIGEPSHLGFTSATTSVWYTWTAPSSGTFTMSLCGSTFDSLIAVYTGSTLTGLTQRAAGDDSCGVQSRVTFLATAATIYNIAVAGYAATTGAVTLTIESGPGAACERQLRQRRDHHRRAGVRLEHRRDVGARRTPARRSGDSCRSGGAGRRALPAPRPSRPATATRSCRSSPSTAALRSRG